MKLFIQSQNKSEKALLNLLDKFKPLLLKYAIKLGYQDAFFDLRTCFIKLVYEVNLNNFPEEKYLLSYIKKSIYHSYINLSKKNTKAEKQIPFSTFCEEGSFFEDNNIYVYDSSILLEIKSILLPKELLVIYNIYFNDMSVAEIAKNLGVSRQYTNEIKNKALDKLRLYFKGGDDEYRKYNKSICS